MKPSFKLPRPLAMVCSAFVFAMLRETDAQFFEGIEKFIANSNSDKYTAYQVILSVLGGISFMQLIMTLFIYSTGMVFVIQSHPGFLKVSLCLVLLIQAFGTSGILGLFYFAIFPYTADWKTPKLLNIITTLVYGLSFVYIGYASLLLVLGFIASCQRPNRREKEVRVEIENGDAGLPMVYTIMPIYNEDPQALLTAITSFTNDVIYPKNRLRLILAFDDENRSELFLQTLNALNIQEPANQPARIDGVYEGVHVTFNRFPHGGKRVAQSQAFHQVREEVSGLESLDNILVLFIDSDIILHKHSVRDFVAEMVAKPKRVALTGLITCRTSQSANLLRYLQDAEYIFGQMFHRSIESLLGTITCLPGALTMVKYSALFAVHEQYFVPQDYSHCFDFMRHHLGEDRYLTHLLMERFDKGAIGFCPTAKCKTEAPGDYPSLLKQRRRWLLGHIANEVWTLSTPIFWWKYPVLMLIRMLDSSISSNVMGPIAIVQLCFYGFNWASAFMLITSIGPLWLYSSFHAIREGRIKIIFIIPFFWLLTPLLFWTYLFYGIISMNKQSWGGPRTNQNSKYEKIPLNEPAASTDDEKKMTESSPEKKMEIEVRM